VPLPLTRTACLADYPDCVSVAGWQQCHAIEAYHHWSWDPATGPAGDVLCFNWGAAHFRAPGRAPCYLAYQEQEPCLDRYTAIFALSVLDRVPSPLRFLRSQAARLALGGLLVCTFAAWDATGQDCAVGCEMRRRIYDWTAWSKLVQEIKGLGLHPYGGVDLHYHGHTLGDHTLATLVAVKDRRI